MTTAAPSRLGRDFRWLWAGFASSNLADGVLLAAGPLLVTSITLAPVAVAGALVAQRLPWLLFGLLAGEVVDRVDRRRLMVVSHAARAVVLAALVGAVLTDRLSLVVVYATMFLLGSAETFADNAGSTLVVATVRDESLGVANARLVGTRTVANQLAGPPLGALLFGVGVALPFVVEATLLLLAAVLVAQLPARARADGGDQQVGAGLRQRLAEGLRWLRNHPPVRRLAIVIALFNLTFGATYSILVLYAFDRLGLDEAGFGLLLTAGAVGGVVGAAIYPWVERRCSYTAMLRTGLLVETSMHLLLASTTSWAVAGAVLVAFGVHGAVWGSLSTTIRLRATPEHLLGRVNSIYLLAVLAPLSAGALLGGLVAERAGVVAVLWYAGAGAACTTVWAWRGLADLGRYEVAVGATSPT